MPLAQPSLGAWRSLRQIETAQQDLLRAHLHHCRSNSPYYREVLAGVDPQSATLDTLARIPFADKTAFGKRNRDFLAVPFEQIVDIALTSGTTGSPSSVMYTERDLQRIAYNEALSFAACGVTREDVVLLTCTLDRCFVAGLAYQMGLRRLGAAVIRNGASTMQSHFDLIAALKPTLLVGVPTFLKKLAFYHQENDVDPASTSVRKLVCIGEPLRNADLSPLDLGNSLEALWNADAYSTYASSETCATFCECEERQGGHLHPELAIVEIVDAKGRRLPDGEPGEVVVTPLQAEAMPLLRFKTGDTSFFIAEPCRCGRITPRLGPILGRKSQMLKTKGTTVYPLSILSALSGIPGLTEYYVVATSVDRLSDHVTVHAAISGDACSAEHIAERLQSRLRVKTSVVIEPEAAIARMVFGSGSRKAIRFVDNRVHTA